jgi:hypothetical protein
VLGVHLEIDRIDDRDVTVSGTLVELIVKPQTGPQIEQSLSPGTYLWLNDDTGAVVHGDGSGAKTASPASSSDGSGDEVGPEEVREGVLGVSKGNPAIDGALLPHDLVKATLGDDWTKTAVGRRVRGRGRLRIHHCGREEQCLMSGEIPFFEATSLELLK